ncbi:MAG TPA: G1 family glutamic endopeptidase [Streptosporangiaceae bacterium]|jgi:hypothetical protein|nr:G1 family glutamic endopeptidase [Streptosporangiaceae bacterium]
MRRILKIAAAAAVVLPLTLAAPAASASTHGARAPAATCGGVAALVWHGKCVSANWAGYLAIGHGSYNTVKAGWTQPATPSSAGGRYSVTSIWVGIGGGRQGDTIPVQVGTLMTNGSLARNLHGHPLYSAFYETPATSGAVTISGFTVRAGDDMAAEVEYLNGSFQMFLWDYTSGSHWSSGNIQGNYSRDTAEVIVEAPANVSGLYDLAPFGSVQFNDVNLGQMYALTMMRGSEHRTLISVSRPSGCCSFTATYHYSS